MNHTIFFQTPTLRTKWQKSGSIEEPMERIAQHLRNMEVQPSIE
jgi:hypothetical protein